MRTFRLIALCLVLGGCASQRPAPATLSPDQRQGLWEARRGALERLSRFTIEGRAAVQRGGEGGSLKLHWAQADHDTDLKLMAPLAQGTFRIERHGDGVALSTPDGHRYVAADFETLMKRHLQWSFPIDGARFWVRGVPDPAVKVDNLQLDDHGQLTDLAQSGWRISVLGYTRVGDRMLPGKLLLSAGDVKIRLVIDRWELPAP